MNKNIYHISRIFLGLVFLFSGFVKAVDPMGTAIKFDDYFNYAFNLPGFTPLSLPLSFIMCGVEFMVGAMLLLNILPKLSSWMSVLLMAVFTPLTLYLAVANPVSDCGCFGDAVKLSNWATFWKNIVIDVLLIIVFINRKKYLPKYSLKFQQIATITIAMLIFGFELYNYSYLPVLDFRPYKEGANIRELTIIPDNAEQPEYATFLLYENSKTGEVKEFSEDNYPWDDSTWIWKETKSKMIKQGYVPPIHDFTPIGMDETDMTDSILNSDDTIILVVTYNLEETKMKNIEKTKNYIDSVKLKHPHLKVYCLTASQNNLINKVRIEQKLNDWTFCKIDETVAKTIIRSNPGLVVMKDGIIIQKVHYHSLKPNHIKF